VADVVTSEALADWLTEFARLVHTERDQLTALDAAIGDADHGSNMDRGMTAVLGVLPSVRTCSSRWPAR
jgi:dihydroxyacetone kinase-like protein